MTIAIVADDPGTCGFRAPGVALVKARDYLLGDDWRQAEDVQVINLSRNCGYQRGGYYVSLLADARGHCPLPGIATLKDLGTPRPARLLVAATQRCVERRRRATRAGFDLAILRDPQARCPASNEAAVEKFRHAASMRGIRAVRLGRHDIGRLREFDGLFVRDNTFVQHYTYRFARRAASLGMTVIDDPDSILRCNSKVYLAELLPRHGVPVPRTLVVDRADLGRVLPAFGLPCVLKSPDSSLSLGVSRVESESELLAVADRMLRQSDLIVAQEYLPTPFDWRVGVLDGKPLFVCKYHMVAGHWQIVRHVPGEHYEEGRTEAIALVDAPATVLDLALRAARLFGRSFYGVDIKQLGQDDFRVIEVNDNPNVDAGNEDGVLHDRLYEEVMDVFARRMAARRPNPP